MAAINEKGLLGKFLVWRVRYIKEKQFIVMLSILVGIVTGLAGVVLKNMVHFTHMFFTERMQVDSGNLLFFIYPFSGILLTTLFVKFFVKEGISHGVTKVLYAISRRNSMIKPHNNYTSMIASYHRVDRGIHRFESGTFVSDELQGDDLDDRLWSGRCHCRDL